MPSLAFALRNLLRDLKSGELAVLVLVTHDRQLAARCDRIVRLEAGRVVPS